MIDFVINIRNRSCNPHRLQDRCCNYPCLSYPKDFPILTRFVSTAGFIEVIRTGFAIMVELANVIISFNAGRVKIAVVFPVLRQTAAGRSGIGCHGSHYCGDYCC
jgi:hypothetical protein